MVRVIKYRAWLKKEKKMVYVVDIELKNKFVLFYDKSYKIHSKPFNEVELLQFTGLKDINGVEIYESDILRIPDYYKEVICDDGSGPSTLEYHLSEVVYSEKYGCFGVDIKENMEWYDEGFHSLWEVSTVDEEIRVIGNKFENPELLEA